MFAKAEGPTTARLRQRAARAARALASFALVSAFAACAANHEASRDAPRDPVLRESRTGVPFLMDLPLVGWLFQRRVTVR